MKDSMSNISEVFNHGKMSRRSLLKWTGVVGASTLFLNGCQLESSEEPAKKSIVVDDIAIKDDDRVVPTCSAFDCGGKCMVKAHVNDGVITRISTRTDEELSESNPMMKACIRGRSYRKYQYHPDRLKYPMKRVGKRGEGKFERISWEEAIDTIVSETTRITEEYGPESRYIHVGTGTTGGIMDSESLAGRLFSLTGGYLKYYHSVSMGNTAVATPYTYGISNTGNSLDTLADTKLVILWGHNPVETIFGHTNYYYQKMKENGCKFIVVDPRYSDTAISYADEWIPLLPTTDNALMDAMAYVIVTEDLYDKEFVDKFCLGFDEEHMPKGVPENESVVSYLLGKKDGIEKTPEWAEKICKVPADKIIKLARDYATTKPAALIQGWGPQRHSCGERTVRGATMLASITGNVGIKGGWASGYGGIPRKQPSSFPVPENPFEGSISVMSWLDAIVDAKNIKPEDGLKGVEQLDQNVKLIYNLAGNYLACQTTDINKSVKALEDENLVEFILVSDHFMTPSAKYADILLPDTTFFERDDVGGTWGSGDYFMLAEKVVEDYYESRAEYEWLSEVAERMGVGEEYTEGRTRSDWIKYLLEETKKSEPEIPTFKELQKNIFYGWKYDEPRIAFKEQIEDPENNPFETPSGKIELFSKRLYDMENSEIPAIPRYVSAWEGPEDELTGKYPLQLIAWKVRNRANSTFYGNTWLREAMEQVLWINPLDAEERSIKDGDKVKVYNDRGATMVDVRVTPRIIPGVIALPSGSWYDPDENGVDQNGCINVLTTFRKTALAHGNAHHTILVDIDKA